MARSTGNWTLRSHRNDGTVRTVDISIEWDRDWAAMWYSVDGGATVRETAKVTINRLGRYAIRRDKWGTPVIVAAPISSVYVVSESFGHPPVRGEAKTIKGAVETWASKVASAAIGQIDRPAPVVL